MGIVIKKASEPRSKCLLTPKEAGEYLQVAPATLEKWRMKKIGPKYARFANRTVRYSIIDLENFVFESKIMPTAQKN